MDDAAPLAPTVVSSTGANYHWTLHAETDPQLPARVLGVFTVRNEGPWYFRVRRVAGDRLHVEVRARSDDDRAAQRLAWRLRGIPTVIDVAFRAIRNEIRVSER